MRLSLEFLLLQDQGEESKKDLSMAQAVVHGTCFRRAQLAVKHQP